MQNYENFYITSNQNQNSLEQLNLIIDQLNNDPTVIDYSIETESRGENDYDHEYFIQIIRK